MNSPAVKTDKPLPWTPNREAEALATCTPTGQSALRKLLRDAVAEIKRLRDLIPGPPSGGLHPVSKSSNVGLLADKLCRMGYALKISRTPMGLTIQPIQPDGQVVCLPHISGAPDELEDKAGKLLREFTNRFGK